MKRESIFTIRKEYLTCGIYTIKARSIGEALTKAEKFTLDEALEVNSDEPKIKITGIEAIKPE